MTDVPNLFISLPEILGYAIAAFAFGLVLTPWFINFLRRNKIGKTLRVQAVDGRSANVFNKYHQHKFGTPTMGGILIWGAILCVFILSKVLAALSIVDRSILQRDQVYLPLFLLLSFAFIGAVDDYFNIIGSDTDRLKRFVPKVKKFLLASTVVIAAYLVYETLFLHVSLLDLPGVIRQDLGPLGPIIFLFFGLFVLTYISLTGVAVQQIFQKFAAKQAENRGLSVWPKVISLLLISIVGATWFHYRLGYDSISIPFLMESPLYVGWLYVPIFILIIFGTANAVNVTDGLDGLAAGLLSIAYGSFGLIAYAHNQFVLAAFCAVTVGAIAAFLWHNVPPALFYMGDTGSMALGGTLAVIAMMTDNLFILPLVGFMFVVEILSVIIQLTSKKLRGGKKVFRSAPIHHHFEALEWGESKVVMRFWIIGIFMATLGVLVGVFG